MRLGQAWPSRRPLCSIRTRRSCNSQALALARATGDPARGCQPALEVGPCTGASKHSHRHGRPNGTVAAQSQSAGPSASTTCAAAGVVAKHSQLRVSGELQWDDHGRRRLSCCVSRLADAPFLGLPSSARRDSCARQAHRSPVVQAPSRPADERSLSLSSGSSSPSPTSTSSAAARPRRASRMGRLASSS